ncbi:MAG: hypothetical protein RJA69_70, partial [Pseudomonadota bacterium]
MFNTNAWIQRLSVMASVTAAAL